MRVCATSRAIAQVLMQTSQGLRLAWLQRADKLFYLSGLYCNNDGKKSFHCSRVAAAANLQTWRKEFPHLAAVDRCLELLRIENQAHGGLRTLLRVPLEVQWNLHVPVLCVLLWLACVSVLRSDDREVVC